MHHSIRFVDPETVVISTFGAASLEGLDSVVADLLREVRYRPGLALVFDHSRLDLNGLHREDVVRRLHIPLKEADLIGPRRIALVTSDARIADVQALRPDEPHWELFPTVEDALDSLTRTRSFAGCRSSA